MQDYNVSDYGILSNAVSTTKAYQEKITASKTVSSEVKTTLSNEAVFKGPVQEEVASKLATLDTDLSGIETNFNTLANYIIEAGNNYKAGDQAASTTITDSSSTTGSTLSTTVSNTGLTQSTFTEKLNSMGTTPTKQDIINLAKQQGISEDYAKIIIGTTANEGFVKDAYLNYGWASAMINLKASKETIYSWGGGNNFYSESNINNGYEGASDEVLKSVYLALTNRNSKIVECNGMYSSTPGSYNAIYTSTTTSPHTTIYEMK